MHIWDIGGQVSLRPFWRNYYEMTDGLVWVIDGASSPQRILESKKMLHEVLASSSSLSGASLLIFLNKMDLPNPISPKELEEVWWIHYFPVAFGLLCNKGSSMAHSAVLSNTFTKCTTGI